MPTPETAPRAEGPVLQEAAGPAITIVMAFRERWSLTLASVESVLANTTLPYRFWFLDIGMPAPLRARLQEVAVPRGLEIVPLDPEDFWPNRARRRIAGRIDTRYAVFIDNDVLVMPGWLEALVRCADETGAGIVGPLYLWGEDARTDLIHMAGGELRVEHEGERKVMRERHRLINARLGDVEHTLKREPCGFAEYHCLLMRSEVVHAPDTFDPDIVCVHEHVHASLVARELGYRTWMEPAARINYLAKAPWRLMDLPLARRRWSRAAGEASLQRFAQRWKVIDDERSFGDVRNFLVLHSERMDPLLADGSDRSSPMRREDLEQNMGPLLTAAERRGYTQSELRLLEKSCLLATRLSEGVYRPCGRPFVNHLMGTASVLVHYGLRMRLVQAGLLHAAYSHGLMGQAEPPADALARITATLGGAGVPLERRVRAYTLRQPRYRALISARTRPTSLRIEDAEVLILEATNEIEMHLSGEVETTGRSDLPDGPLRVMIGQVCRLTGMPGMATTVEAFDRPQASSRHRMLHPEPGSFRFTGSGTLSAIRRFDDLVRQLGRARHGFPAPS